jgi:hypothetical protein
MKLVVMNMGFRKSISHPSVVYITSGYISIMSASTVSNAENVPVTVKPFSGSEKFASFVPHGPRKRETWVMV